MRAFSERFLTWLLTPTLALPLQGGGNWLPLPLRERVGVRVLIVVLVLLLTACQTGAETALPPTTAIFTPTPQIGVSFATRAVPTVAVIQTTPTPLPTPTATPTATPIVYQIVSGDTLLGIAIERGTTVEEIVALNPGIVPENLQIGQPVVLPPPATVNPLLAPGTAVPIRVAITKIHAYQTPLGSLWLLGEVTNEGETAVENIQVEIGVLAADGRSLGQRDGLGGGFHHPAGRAWAVWRAGQRAAGRFLAADGRRHWRAGGGGAGQPHAGHRGAGRRP
jgi:LysM repeat protein